MTEESSDSFRFLPASPNKFPNELLSSALRKDCNPSILKFSSTDDLPDLKDVIGQPRAFRALELGTEVKGPGYNIFILGQPGSGRTTLSMEYLQRKASGDPVPDDWCYVFNFDKPHEPRALALPAGRGIEFKKDIEGMIALGERELQRLFESDEYTRARDQIINGLKKNEEGEFLRLQEFVEKYKFAILRTPFGVVLVPAIGGKPLTPEEIQNLTQEQKSKLEELQAKLGVEVEKSIIHMRDLAQTAAAQIAELDTRTVLYLIDPILNSYLTKYQDLENIVNHLLTIKKDIIENASTIHLPNPEQKSPTSQISWSERYSVNLIVDNSKLKGAPVILETQPGYYNLLGRIEHMVITGATHTDYTMIRAGALHQANGGYLILSARDLLVNPYAWEGIKRVLRDGAIRMIELASQLGMLSTETLEPEPIPLNIKIILVGTPTLYYLLRAYDEDFAKLFKVRAEFATSMDRNEETEAEYGLFVRSVVEDNHLQSFDSTAVARIIEYSSRLAEDQEKLTTRFGRVADLIVESAYWAKKTNQDDLPGKFVTAAAVQRAIDENLYRNNLMEERIQELIQKDVLMIDTQESQVGQINALSVYSLGDYSFGRPCRVTASVYPGRAGVIDIERQARLGGPIHTKGILILAGFLGSRFGRTSPLTITASLTFEQSYDEIEGDSASAAELLCLLSAIAGIPLRQDISITGSVNQHGQIQAIGGINEKIEGFFNTCLHKGLTGTQGVMFPAANRKHLMLPANIITAVESKQFHIWAIRTIDEAMTLLTGIEPGVPQADGSYPVGTINNAISNALLQFARIYDKEQLDQINSKDKEDENQDQ